MPSDEHYMQAVMKAVGGDEKLALEWETEAEAKAVLAKVRLVQKELRLIKRDVNTEMRDLRTIYKDKIAGTTAGLGSRFLLGKGRAKSSAAAEKRIIRARRDRELRPYEDVKRTIDNALLQFDKAKAQISTWMEEQKT